jgi:hypothetical protein
MQAMEADDERRDETATDQFAWLSLHWRKCDLVRWMCPVCLRWMEVRAMLLKIFQ